MKLPPLPLVPFSTATYDDAAVTLYVDPFSKWGGALGLGGRVRAACPDELRAQVLTWIAIQRERKRLGLPFFDPEDMSITTGPAPSATTRGG